MQKKIVLVEDDKLQSDLVSDALRDAGYDVTQAWDGVEGLDAVKKVNPNLVLLDILMPKMDGFEVMEKLKSDKLTKNIPVVFFTQLSNRDNLDKGMKLGAYGYTVKSHQALDQVVQSVDSFFKKGGVCT